MIKKTLFLFKLYYIINQEVSMGCGKGKGGRKGKGR